MDTAFFILSKLIALALQVDTWLVIGMVVSLVAGRFARPRFARLSGSVTLAALLAVCIFPIGDILLRPLEAEFPPRAAPTHIDGIVVLGGVEDPWATAAWREPQLNEAAERPTAAAALAIAHPEARLVFSGGSGRLRNTVLGQPDIPSVAVYFFVSLGIDVSGGWLPPSLCSSDLRFRA